jgi:hypothetical protein
VKKGSGWVSRKHAAFAPARQKRLGFRLRSPLPSVEEPCPLSLQTVFLDTQPDPYAILRFWQFFIVFVSMKKELILMSFARVFIVFSLSIFLSASYALQEYSRPEALKVVEALEKIQNEQSSRDKTTLQKILITESELDSYIAYRIEQEKEETMKTLRLKLFNGNRIEGMTVINLKGQKIPAFLRPEMTLYFRAKLNVKEGKIKFEVEDLFLEGQRIQPMVVDAILAIAARIDKTEATSINDWYELPYGIKNIKTERGKAMIYY